ncbi:hypothetical protein POM88_044066 [Heracleum sosnowskyi]|uniref:Uncharacterized protein n=1 Tax=Heracleum sosnowskyi TaxID=360622 RepID=A0AAD8H4Q1_9APIA|nr:hypothetical protein POM88_044066 [Heracleum sosnowskyi]
MDRQKTHIQEMEEAFATFQIEDEDQGGINYEGTTEDLGDIDTRIFEIPVESIEKPYGAWLRAEPRRKVHTMGAKWLRSGGSFQAKNSGGNGEENTDMDNPANSAHGDQINTNAWIDS